MGTRDNVHNNQGTYLCYVFITKQYKETIINSKKDVKVKKERINNINYVLFKVSDRMFY